MTELTPPSESVPRSTPRSALLNVTWQDGHYATSVNRRYEVTIEDRESMLVDVLTVLAPTEAIAIGVAKDTIDYRDRRNVGYARTSVRVVGDKPQHGDIVLKDE
jgi:hypothetical protein